MPIMGWVKELSETLSGMKGNLKRLEVMTRAWAAQPLFERGAKTSTAENFQQMQSVIVTQRQAKCAAIREGGLELHKLLKDTNRKLKVSAGLPDWKNYVDFVNSLVVQGLIKVVAGSLGTLNQQMSHSYIVKQQLPPMLELEMHLAGGKVAYVPDIGTVESRVNPEKVVTNAAQGQKGQAAGRAGGGGGGGGGGKGAASWVARATLRRMAWGWVEGFLNVTKAFRRIDGTDGTYLKDIQVLPGVSHVFGFINPRDGSSKTHWLRQIHPVFRVGKMWVYSPLTVAPSTNQDSIVARPGPDICPTWVTKWIYLFAQSLQDHVSSSLERMYSFIAYTQKGLETPLSAEDKDGIMSTMTHIRDVRKKAPMVTGLFGPLKDTVLLLKSRGIPVDLPPVNKQPALEFLDSAYMLWDNTVNKAYRVKGEIQPLQNAAADGVRKDIANFGEEVKAFVALFKRTAPFAAAQKRTSVDDRGGDSTAAHPFQAANRSYKKLDNIQQSLRALEAKALSMRELEELFELSATRHTGLVEVRTQLRLLKMVWDVVGLVDGLFASWTATLWADIKTDELLEEARSLQLHIRGLPRRIRDWGLYKAVDERVVNMSTVLPLIHELHSPAMRDRHWKDLLDVTDQHRPPAQRRLSRQARRRSSTNFGLEGHGEFQPPQKRITLATVLGPSFSLEDALSLDLHKYVDACMEAVEVATKELKVETRLRNIETRWKEEQLSFVRHRDTEVFVLFGADEVLEALEDHQMQLQGMAGMGKFVDFFREEVTEWQATLGEVETFLKLMLTVQR
ncbi:unnamed protein product, partial [Ectocarpus sp. 8 AP-2014]